MEKTFTHSYEYVTLKSRAESKACFEIKSHRTNKGREELLKYLADSLKFRPWQRPLLVIFDGRIVEQAELCKYGLAWWQDGKNQTVFSPDFWMSVGNPKISVKL